MTTIASRPGTRIHYASFSPAQRSASPNDSAVAYLGRATIAIAHVPRDRRGALGNDGTVPVSAPAPQRLHGSGEGNELLRIRGRATRVLRAGCRVRQQF